MQGATKLRDRIEPNEKATEVPDSVQKGVYYTRKTTECVVGVSDFLMTSLARLTVKVGRGVKGMVEESEVNRLRCLVLISPPFLSPLPCPLSHLLLPLSLAPPSGSSLFPLPPAPPA